MPVCQLPLGLALRDEATFANFFPGDNTALIKHLQDFREPFIYLWGPDGAGRTHLLQACCHAILPQQAVYLDLTEPELEPAVLVDLEFFPLVCLDNIQAVLNAPDWNLALFNLYNRMGEQGGRLLVAALVPPAQLSCRLSDLQSRLSWGLTLALRPLTDDQKLQALQLRARRRGLELSAEAGGFLLRHYPRDTHQLFAVLETLDREAMSAKRRLTIPFLKLVLDRSFAEVSR